MSVDASEGEKYNAEQINKYLTNQMIEDNTNKSGVVLKF